MSPMTEGWGWTERLVRCSLNFAPHRDLVSVSATSNSEGTKVSEMNLSACKSLSSKCFGRMCLDPLVTRGLDIVAMSG